MIQAVLFDLDNTLIDRQAAFRRIAERFYHVHPAMSRRYALEEICARLVEWEDDGDADRAWLFQQVRDTWPEIQDSVSAMVNWYREQMATAVEPDTRVLGLLEGLTRAGTPWGIITNGGPGQRAKILAAGFEAITPFAILSDEFGYRKPDPRIYKEGLWRLGGVMPAYTLFVGDKPQVDIVGAQQVGLQTAWVRRGKAYPAGLRRPDFEIDHVQELRSVLFA
ncbi:MAG: HAD-IA family hydrolase [Chloroflexi bacterium]|nr:HAD-IA family hydrolase [Chloroflexota bacterium]